MSNPFAVLADAGRPSVVVDQTEEHTTDSQGFTSLTAGDRVLQISKAYPASFPQLRVQHLSIFRDQYLYTTSANRVCLGELKDLQKRFANLKGNHDSGVFESPVSFQVEAPVSHLAFSFDGSKFYVAASQGGLLVYNTKSVNNGRTEIVCPALLDLLANPANDTVALLSTSGDLFLLKNESIQQVGSGISAISWSKKGKQIMAGQQNGSLIQYNPAGDVKAQLPAVNDEAGGISSLCWLENDLLTVAYRNRDNDIAVYLLRRSTAQGITSLYYTLLANPSPSWGDTSHEPNYFFIPISKSLVLTTCTTSADIGLISIPRKSALSIEDEVQRGTLRFSEARETEVSLVGIALQSTADEKFIWFLDNDGGCGAWKVDDTENNLFDEGPSHGVSAKKANSHEATMSPFALNPASTHGASPFIAPSAATSLFGSGSPFANPATSAISSPFNNDFGAPSPCNQHPATSTNGLFGGNDNKIPAFGTKPVFGSSTFGAPAFGSAPVFGSTGLGSNAATKPAFGSTTFGSSVTAPTFGGFGIVPAQEQTKISASMPTEGESIGSDGEEMEDDRLANLNEKEVEHVSGDDPLDNQSFGLSLAPSSSTVTRLQEQIGSSKNPSSALPSFRSSGFDFATKTLSQGENQPVSSPKVGSLFSFPAAKEGGFGFKPTAISGTPSTFGFAKSIPEADKGSKTADFGGNALDINAAEAQTASLRPSDLDVAPAAADTVSAGSNDPGEKIMLRGNVDLSPAPAAAAAEKSEAEDAPLPPDPTLTVAHSDRVSRSSAIAAPVNETELTPNQKTMAGSAAPETKVETEFGQEDQAQSLHDLETSYVNLPTCPSSPLSATDSTGISTEDEDIGDQSGLSEDPQSIIANTDRQTDDGVEVESPGAERVKDISSTEPESTEDAVATSTSNSGRKDSQEQEFDPEAIAFTSSDASEGGKPSPFLVSQNASGSPFTSTARKDHEPSVSASKPFSFSLGGGTAPGLNPLSNFSLKGKTDTKSALPHFTTGLQHTSQSVLGFGSNSTSSSKAQDNIGPDNFTTSQKPDQSEDTKSSTAFPKLHSDLSIASKSELGTNAPESSVTSIATAEEREKPAIAQSAPISQPLQTITLPAYQLLNTLKPAESFHQGLSGQMDKIYQDLSQEMLVVAKNLATFSSYLQQASRLSQNLDNLPELSRKVASLQDQVNLLNDGNKQENTSIALLESSMVRLEAQKVKLQRLLRAQTDSTFTQSLKMLSLGPEHAAQQKELRRLLGSVEKDLSQFQSSLLVVKAKLASESQTAGVPQPSITAENIQRASTKIARLANQQERLVEELHRKLSGHSISSPVDSLKSSVLRSHRKSRSRSHFSLDASFDLSMSELSLGHNNPRRTNVIGITSQQSRAEGMKKRAMIAIYKEAVNKTQPLKTVVSSS